MSFRRGMSRGWIRPPIGRGFGRPAGANTANFVGIPGAIGFGIGVGITSDFPSASRSGPSRRRDTTSRRRCITRFRRRRRGGSTACAGSATTSTPTVARCAVDVRWRRPSSALADWIRGACRTGFLVFCSRQKITLSEGGFLPPRHEDTKDFNTFFVPWCLRGDSSQVCVGGTNRWSRNTTPSCR